MSQFAESSGKTQDILERLLLSGGLGTPLSSPTGAGGSGQGVGSLVSLD